MNNWHAIMFKMQILILIILTLPTIAFSAGKIVIKPIVSASWRMDNNFFKAETIEREVYTYLFKPGLEFGYETAKSSILAMYTLDMHRYDDQDALQPGWIPADRDDYNGHTGDLKLSTKPTDRLTLGLDESFRRSRDPANADENSNAIDRDKFDINRITPRLSYNFGPKFTAGIRYRRTDTDYDLATREDSTEKRPMFDIIYNLDQKTSIDLEYQHWTRDYDLLTSDYTSDQVKLILRKQFNRFAMEAGGGYHERDFDDPTLNDIDVFTYRVGLIGQNPAPPDQARSSIRLVAEQNFNDSGVGDSYFTSTRFILGAGYVYKEKLPLGLSASYQISDYERTYGLTPAGVNVLRKDDTLNLEGSIGYILREWLKFTLKSGYQERDSNLMAKDYDNRYMMATLDFSYDIGNR